MIPTLTMTRSQARTLEVQIKIVPKQFFSIGSDSLVRWLQSNLQSRCVLDARTALEAQVDLRLEVGRLIREALLRGRHLPTRACHEEVS